MNENELILKAIRQPSPVARKKKVMREIEPDIVDDTEDAIWRLVKQEKKREKLANKTLSSWGAADFVRHIERNLRLYNLKLERYGLNDNRLITKLYDIFVDRIGGAMNNAVLKEYFEWWINCHSHSMHGKKISLYTFVKDKYISKFMNRFEVRKEVADGPDDYQKVSDEEIFQMGGMPMLLIKRGIVITYKILRRESESLARKKISNTLQNFSADLLIEVMKNTLSNAPYPMNDTIDFLLLARQSLESNNLTQFMGVKYKEYFID